MGSGNVVGAKVTDENLKVWWILQSWIVDQGLGTISRVNLDFMAAHITMSSLTVGGCQGYKPVLRNANDVNTHGLCFEAKRMN
jgi:hypothetical protein